MPVAEIGDGDNEEGEADVAHGISRVEVVRRIIVVVSKSNSVRTFL